MNTNTLIKYAAARLYNIKAADVGYTGGYFPELWDRNKQYVPGSSVIGTTLSFIYNHPKATLGTAAAIGGGIYLYNKYKDWKEQEEAKKRNLPKVIPSEVLADDKSDVPVEVLADDSSDVPASVKASSYRKVNKVLNWIYS